ncbi:MAG TPA: serine hydrolase [Dehalococcoidia bacterium]|nr:serine hydrolase [Dehalococcoidia bacterium]
MSALGGVQRRWWLWAGLVALVAAPALLAGGRWLGGAVEVGGGRGIGSLPGGGPAAEGVRPTPLVQPTATPVATAEATASPSPTPQPLALGPDGPTPSVPEGPSPGPPPAWGDLPETVDAPPALLALRDRLAAAIDDYRQRTGTEAAIAVVDLQTGGLVSVNGNRPQRTGCTINLFALLAVVSEMAAGRASPDVLAPSIRLGIGGSYPPEVKRMLELAFGSYGRGLQRARELMSSLGIDPTRFDHVPYYGNGTRNNYLTALELAAALTRLYRGELFDDRWSAYTLARLREVNPGLNYIVPGQLPRQAMVAHKIGYHWDWDGWVNNDAGIVTFVGADGRAKAYVVVYMSEKAPSEYVGYSFGARLSRLVWDHFVAEYGLAR